MAELEPGEFCWRSRGVTGDGSCPRLAAQVHCHNCPDFAAAGRSLLERRPPEGLRDEWSRVLASPKPPARLGEQAVLIFRLGVEWLALPLRLFARVTDMPSVHRVPHFGEALRGMVNLEGELLLCLRLERILTLDRAPAASRMGETPAAPGEEPRASAPAGVPSGPAPRRLLVLSANGQAWGCGVDEVVGLASITPGEVEPPPATVTRAPLAHVRGVFAHQDRRVALLDEELLFSAFARSLR